MPTPRRWFIVTTILLILPLTALLLISSDFDQAQAYPPPPNIPDPYPYPAYQPAPPPAPPSTLPPANTLNYNVYFPFMPNATPPILFSVAGAEPAELALLIPDPDFALDGYSYNRLPNPNSNTQLFSACNGTGFWNEHNWCWIVNGVRTNHLNQPVRSNIAAISTPRYFPPSASSGTGSHYATDNRLDDERYWQVGQTGNDNPIQWLEIDLHPTVIDGITITWASYNSSNTYATNYEIQIKTATSTDWETIRTETNGNGGVDYFNLTTNTLLIEDIRLYLTEPADPNLYYAVDEFEVTGFVPDQLLELGTPIATWVATNPGKLWLMANEPDNYQLDKGDGLPPADYAEFYGRVGTLIKTADPTAELVFCQGTQAGQGDGTSATKETKYQFPHGIGMRYCEKVVALMTDTLASLGSPYTFDELVQGVSVHQYMSVTPISTTQLLNNAMSDWTFRLTQFEYDVNGHEALKDKPLYLTEYGDYRLACPFDPPPANVCGSEDPSPYYGAHYQEGFWAVIHHTTDYLWQSANPQWAGAWWFGAGGKDDVAWTGGLLNEARLRNTNGNRFRDTLNCFIHGISCPWSP